MNKQKAVSPILLWMVIFTGILILLVSTPTGQFFSRNIFTSLLFYASIVYWIYFFNKAIKVNRSAIYSTDKIEEVIQKGAYGMVRHPIYAADIVLVWGIFLHWPFLRTFMGVVWITLMLLFWMKLEEISLEQKFGQVYRDYKRKVPMIIPRFWKKKNNNA